MTAYLATKSPQARRAIAQMPAAGLKAIVDGHWQRYLDLLRPGMFSGVSQRELQEPIDAGSVALPSTDEEVEEGLGRADRIHSEDDDGNDDRPRDRGTGFGPDGTACFSCLNLYFNGPDGLEFFQTLEVSKSTDGGRTWSFPVTAVPGGETFSFSEEDGCFEVEISGQTPDKEYISAGSPAAGDTEVPRNRVYMSYTNFFLAKSTNGRTTWTDGAGTPAGVEPGPAGRVNDDTTERDQFFAWLTIQRPAHNGDDDDPSPSEVVWVSWGDRRRDVEDIRYDIFASRSLDLGATFETNMRVTSPATAIGRPVSPATPGPSNPIPDPLRPGDARINPQPQFGGTFIGDYFGLDASPFAVFASWTDARLEGSQDNFVGTCEADDDNHNGNHDRGRPCEDDDPND